MNTKQYIKDYLLADVLIGAIAYFVFFNQLGHLPINNWDEGIYATNVIEMKHNGIFMVKYFWGSPEMWGTQPPLVAWLQLISAYVFGFNELGYRVPSALAGFFTVILIVRFAHKELGNRFIGYFAACVLMTTTGYVSYHVTRTGDFDSLMIFFVFSYTIYFYKFIKYEKTKYFYITLLCLICAYFSKSVAGLIFLLPLLIFTAYSRKLKFVFTNKELYIGIFSFLVITVSYYLFRENVNPGYIKTAWNNEVATRMLVSNEGHFGPFYIYFPILYKSQFVPWFVFFPLTVLLMFARKEYRHISAFLSISIFCYLCVICFSQTKIHWYTAPLFPYLALIIGIGMSIVLDSLKHHMYGTFNYNTLFFLLLATFFCYPIYHTHKTYSQFQNDSSEKIGKILSRAHQDVPQIKSGTVYYTFFSPSTFYYVRFFNLEHGYKFRVFDINYDIPIRNNDTIIYSHNAVAEKLNANYHFRNLVTFDDLHLVVVDSAKKQ